MNILKYFASFSTGRKIFLGYILLVIISISTSFYNLLGLKKLHNENKIIINRDIHLIETSDKLLDAMISQELYARRYAILKSPETLTLFIRRSDEINQLVEKLKTIPQIEQSSIENIDKLYKEFNKTLNEGIKFLAVPSSREAKRYESIIDTNREKLSNLIRQIKLNARADQNERTKLSAKIVNDAFKFTIVLGVVSFLFVAGIAMFITRHISRSVSELKSAIVKFSEGKFEYIHRIKSSDEFGVLSAAFNEMSKRLKQLEEMYLDASPLTHLPGGIAIENVLKKRISAGVPLAFCLLDIDNFKSFNDKYGYARGSEVIKELGNIIEDVVKQHGRDDDFIGHIGGDDFVIITTPESYPALCGEIIERFDRGVVDFYDEEDRKRGFIIGKTRQGQVAKFPILSLSIVVVTNKHRKLTSPIQVGEIAAELKEYAKSIPGSTFIVDKRTSEA